MSQDAYEQIWDAPDTWYQLIYQLGGQSSSYRTLSGAAEALRSALADAYDSGDCQAIRIMAIDYPADGSDPSGLERELSADEMSLLDRLAWTR